MQTHVHQISFKDHFNDGKSVVVIDAGHGGHDPGAMGKKSKEKEIIKINQNGKSSVIKGQ